MEIKNNQNISFKAFYRKSPPCMHYLAQNFNGNRVRFNKALEILDERCSKHKFFDMFYSSNNSIKVVPKDKNVEKYFMPDSKKYLNIPAKDRYVEKFETEIVSEELKNKSNESFFKKIINFFKFKKAKKIVSVNLYYKLPSNVREAVDIIEKIEHSIM